MKTLKTSFFPRIAPASKCANTPRYESWHQFLRLIRTIPTKDESSPCSSLPAPSREKELIQTRIDTLLTQTPLLDSATLLDFKNNGLIKDMPRYLATVCTRIEQLQGFEAQQNIDATSRMLHTLIGPTSMMGAFALAEYLAQLDVEIKHSNTWPLEPHWMQTIEQLYAMTRQALQIHCPTSQP